jgi:predicted DNA-binding ribbon-helix-helix protein
MKENEGIRPISIYLPFSIYKELKQLATQKNLSVSALAREIIIEYLKEQYKR